LTDATTGAEVDHAPVEPDAVLDPETYAYMRAFTAATDAAADLLPVMHDLAAAVTGVAHAVTDVARAHPDVAAAMAAAASSPEASADDGTGDDVSADDARLIAALNAAVAAHRPELPPAGDGEDVAAAVDRLFGRSDVCEPDVITTAETSYRKHPCGTCPFRSDNCDDEHSHFPASRWASLVKTVPEGNGGEDVPAGHSLFSCHKGHHRDAERPTICAGWAALYGYRHLHMRLLVAWGRVPAWLLNGPGPNWPPMHGTWAEVVDHHTWKPGETTEHLQLVETAEEDQDDEEQDPR